MNRCETCKYRTPRGWCVRNEAYVSDGEGAWRELWKLALDALGRAAWDSVEKARAKHPAFVPVVHGERVAAYHAEVAEVAKREIARHDRTGECRELALAAVLAAECHEFLAELARGDFGRALEEAGDVIAVLYRALNGEGRAE